MSLPFRVKSDLIFFIFCVTYIPYQVPVHTGLFKSRPSENSLEDFCTTALLKSWQKFKTSPFPCWSKNLVLSLHFLDLKNKKSAQLRFVKYSFQVQAFLYFHGFDFRDFRFTAVYNSILFSSPFVLLSNLDLHGFFFCVFLCVPTLTA